MGHFIFYNFGERKYIGVKSVERVSCAIVPLSLFQTVTIYSFSWKALWQERLCSHKWKTAIHEKVQFFIKTARIHIIVEKFKCYKSIIFMVTITYCISVSQWYLINYLCLCDCIFTFLITCEHNLCALRRPILSYMWYICCVSII